MENHTADNSGKKVEDRKISSPCHRKDYLYQLWQNSPLLRIVHLSKPMNTKGEPICKLWTLGDFDVSIIAHSWFKKKAASGDLY